MFMPAAKGSARTPLGPKVEKLKSSKWETRGKLIGILECGSAQPSLFLSLLSLFLSSRLGKGPNFICYQNFYLY